MFKSFLLFVFLFSFQSNAKPVLPKVSETQFKKTLLMCGNYFDLETLFSKVFDWDIESRGWQIRTPVTTEQLSEYFQTGKLSSIQTVATVPAQVALTCSNTVFGFVFSQKPKVDHLLIDETWTEDGFKVCRTKYQFTETLMALHSDEDFKNDHLIRKFLFQKRIEPVSKVKYDDQESLACAEKLEGLSFGFLYGLLSSFPN